MEEGQVSRALLHAPACVKVCQSAWALTERKRTHITDFRSEADEDSLSGSMLELSIAEQKSKDTSSVTKSALKGPEFWGIASRLIRGLTHLSLLFASSGLFPEVQYYLGQAQRIAYGTGCLSFQGQIHALLGHHAADGGQRTEGLEQLQLADNVLSVLPHDRSYASLQLSLAHQYRKDEQLPQGRTVIKIAEDLLQKMTTKDFLDRQIHKPPDQDDLSLRMSNLSIKDSKRNIPSRGNRSHGLSKRGTNKAPQVQHATNSTLMALPGPETIPLNRIKDEANRERAFIALSGGDFEGATTTFYGTSNPNTDSASAVLQALLVSQMKLRRNIDQLVADPVFGVLSESTISCPSTRLCCDMAVTSTHSHNQPTIKTTISSDVNRNKASSRKGPRPKSPATPKPELGLLGQARIELNEIASIVDKFSSTITLHDNSHVSSKILLMLSACPSASQGGPISPTSIACALGTSIPSFDFKESLLTSFNRIWQDHGYEKGT